MALHIGEKIREKARERRIGPSELGRMINTSKQNIYSIFKRKTVDTDLLHKLSEALQFDFFSYYIERREGRPEKRTLPQSKQEVAELKKDLEHYKEKCELLEKLNTYLEKEVQKFKKKNLKS